MKKQLTAAALILALLLTTAGCSTAHAVQKLDAAEDRIEDKLDAAEDKLEDSLRAAVTPAPAATQPAPTEEPAPPAPVETLPAPAETLPAAAETLPAPAETLPAAAADPQKLTREQAQKIALEHVGFTADQVTRLRTEYEIDDRIPQFDVEFHQGDWEYEFEIHAETGKILSYDKDHKYD